MSDPIKEQAESIQDMAESEQIADGGTNRAEGASGEDFNDADFKSTVLRALRTVAIAIAVGVPLLGWKAGWGNAGLFAVGALISGSGLMQWLRLLSAVAARIESTGAAPSRPFVSLLVGLFLRLGVALALLYVSLKFLHGSVLALVAGLALGLTALLIESIRLLKSWTD